MKKIIVTSFMLLFTQTLFSQSTGYYEYSSVINDCLKAEQENSTYKGFSGMNVSESEKIDDDPSAPPSNFFNLCKPSSGSYQNTSVISYNPSTANDFCKGGIIKEDGYLFKISAMRHGQSKNYTNFNNNSKGYAKLKVTCNSNNNISKSDIEVIKDIDKLYCKSNSFRVGNFEGNVIFEEKIKLPTLKLSEVFEKEFDYNGKKYKIKAKCTETLRNVPIGINTSYTIPYYDNLGDAISAYSSLGKEQYVAKITSNENNCDFSNITKKSWSHKKELNGIERSFTCHSDSKYTLAKDGFTEKVILTAKSKDRYEKNFESIDDIKEGINKNYGYQILSCTGGKILIEESFCTSHEVKNNALDCDGDFKDNLNNISNLITEKNYQVSETNSNQNGFVTANKFCGSSRSCNINSLEKQTTTGPITLKGKVVSCPEN